MSDQIVIVGGGIIGLCTAFFLVEAREGYGSKITIIDNAPELLLGASGAANGGMSNGRFQGKQYDTLQTLSCSLHHRLAREHEGERRWLLRLLHNVSVSPRGSKQCSEQAIVPRWLPRGDQYDAEVFLDFGDVLYHIFPRAFCEFLIEQCLSKGVSIICNTEAVGVEYTDGRITAVRVSEMGTKRTWTQQCQRLLISAGSWTIGIVEKLFPEMRLGLLKPNPPHKSQHWLNVRDPNWNLRYESDEAGQVLFGPVEDQPLNLTNYSNGLLFVSKWKKDVDPRTDCGDLPPTIMDIVTNTETLSEYQALAAEKLGLSSPEDLQVVRRGRSYYGGNVTGHPITTRLTSDLLWKDAAKRDSGVFISYGHDTGIGLGPGTGKVLSELMLGQELSTDIKQFEIPPEYIS